MMAEFCIIPKNVNGSLYPKIGSRTNNTIGRAKEKMKQNLPKPIQVIERRLKIRNYKHSETTQKVTLSRERLMQNKTTSSEMKNIEFKHREKIETAHRILRKTSVWKQNQGATTNIKNPFKIYGQRMKRRNGEADGSSKTRIFQKISGRHI